VSLEEEIYLIVVETLSVHHHGCGIGVATKVSNANKCKYYGTISTWIAIDVMAPDH
jgi:hypothetical protein